MAISEFEKKRVEKIVGDFIARRRPPAHMRQQLDLSFRVEGQSVEIFELRPLWRDPTSIQEQAVAKATYVKKTGRWKVYWQRADLKWHAYEPLPEVSSLEEFVEEVGSDPLACFWS